jgi:hypothetical protein
VFDLTLDQFVWEDRYRLDAKNLGSLYGSGTSRASYINWIVDYNQQLGVNSSSDLSNQLSNLDVRLCWRMAGFSDKKYLKVYLERSTPGGTNTSLLLPDESYQLLLYENVPSSSLVYSSVVVQKVNDGWAVSGYSQDINFFEIFVSKPGGRSLTISAGGSEVQVPSEYTDRIARVPYGYVFTSRGALCDFLLSYGELLQNRGMVFSTVENGYIMNWGQMAQEFLYWSNQGWGTGSIINLNPTSTVLTVDRPGFVATSLTPSRSTTSVLDQNFKNIPVTDLVVIRQDNQITLRSLTAATINFAKFQFTQFENVMILDNKSLFADLIYDPITGNRQNRIYVSGWLSADWNGLINAPGFIINQNTIQQWQPNRKYTKGDIVLFKDKYWSAADIIQPSQNFDYSQWLLSDYQDIQQGLLQNAANSSDQLKTAYSVYDANLEEENDLFSYGLIGFRPRQYMQALNLDDVSQVNLYQQFLGTKGTRPALEIFSLANLGKETAEYNIYEKWAILRAVYGANANKRYVEIRLNEDQLPSDPSIVQVVQAQQTSVADQTVLISDLWNTSYKVTDTNILPTTLESNPDLDLPTAGYVSLDDADITVFSLDDAQTLNQQLDSIGIGTSIWVAKSNAYDWNIYRTEKTPGRLRNLLDNLDGTSRAVFDANHGLTVGQNIIIKYFNPAVDGVYRVLAVPNPSEIIVAYAFSGFATSASGTGIVLRLQSYRVAQPADISQLVFDNILTANIKVWVDENDRGLWSVLEKQNVFSPDTTLVADIPDRFGAFGETVSQGLFNRAALIGSPHYNPTDSGVPAGALYSFVKTQEDQYQYNALLELNATGTQGYGAALDIGSETWAVAGAAESLGGVGYAATIYKSPAGSGFEQRQIFVPPDQDFGPGEFGYSVTISQDERWLFIGAPAQNKVHAYNQVLVQDQVTRYITNGIDTNYNYSDSIVIDSSQPLQLLVVLNNRLLTYQTDYTIDSNDVILNELPTVNQSLVISRRRNKTLDQTLVNNVAATGGTGTGASFDLNNTRGVYVADLRSGGENYQVGDVLYIAQDYLETSDSPFSSPVVTAYLSGYPSASISVTDTTGIAQGMIVQGVGMDSAQTVAAVTGPTTLDLNAAPDSAPSGNLTFSNGLAITVTAVDLEGSITDYTIAGQGIQDTVVYQLDKYFKTATNIYSFTVQVDGQIQRPKIDYDFNSDSAADLYDLVFNTVPAPGAQIVVNADSYFQYIDTITVPGLPVDARFGHSITCTSDGRTLIVGAPNVSDQQGSAYVFLRSSQTFMVNDPTITQFSTVESLSSPGSINVAVNGNYLLPDANNIGGEFSVDITNPANEFVDVTAALFVGDQVTIETNQWQLAETLRSAVPQNKAQFGFKVDQCINDCSLYVGAPYDSSQVEASGIVEFYQNQARVYGTITSLHSNPTLTPGQYIVVNNYWIASTASNVEQLAEDINTVSPPNAVAQLTPDLLLTGDGKTSVFDVGTIYSAASSYNTVVYVNNVLMTPGSDYSYNNTTQQITFATAPSLDAPIRVVSGRLVILCKNFDASVPLSRLSVVPGSGTLFTDLGFDAYVHQQTILNPLPVFQAHFGESLFISEDTTTLLVGAPNSNTVLPVTFDDGATFFDSNSTRFSDTVVQSGAVYVFNALPAANASINNPLQFVFGQQLTPSGLQPLDRFGSALDYTTGTLLIGAPGSDLGDSSAADFGSVRQFVNAENKLAWQTIRIQQPTVDLARLNQTYLFDISTQLASQYLDYFDPLQGKLLGVVQENLDYIGAVDPAAYNVGLVNNFGQIWGQDQLGKIWWDTNLARFINPSQDNLTYASRRWGQLFPGSSVQVNQWVVSSTPPAAYTGPGVPRDIASYVQINGVNEQGFIQDLYYFWVQGITAVDTVRNKTLSIDAIARYIENPRASGIAYMAPLSSSAVALYNSLDFINNTDTALHIGFEQQANDDPVHTEYQLISQGLPESFLTGTLFDKMLDSLCGVDILGRPVPDPMLPISQRYGVNVRPRQSMVANRFMALKNYLTRANTVLLGYPAADGQSYSLLNSFDPQPTAASGQWDFRVADIEELSYQDLRTVPLGYRYLVDTDVTNNGLWTIYEVIPGTLLGEPDLRLVTVQNYDTRKYWSTVDWYAPGYSSLTQINYNVARYDDLSSNNFPLGSVIKVDNNSRNKWELYLNTQDGYNRIGLQDGTIQISNLLWDYAAGRFGFDREVFDAQYYDEAPFTETRKVLQALNQQVFVGDNLIVRNDLLVLLFNYILSEQGSPTWLTKTSLIDVDHIIRELLPFQVYKVDNQDFVLNYIKEVKPYHTQIDNFNLKYRGRDVYQGTLTDFDLPAFYDSNQRLFISPILDNTGLLSPTSSVPSDSVLWQTFPYNQWFNNYLLGVESVSITAPGSGYISPPAIVVTGECVRQAQMISRINSAGQVIEIIVLDPGEGYTTSAVINFESSAGSGAAAIARMGNSKVRNITTTIKYDRYQYQADLSEWQPNTIYIAGDRVRYANRVWQARAEGSEVVVSEQFDTEQWQLIPAGDLTGVDRTMGYYAPTANQPGLELSLLISGVEYPGVQVSALGFEFNTGFDVGPYDESPFDNISFGPEGQPTYDPALLDAEYYSSFLDPFLGTRPTDINVAGGAFVDTYESHAPEELVPGITYDTLDFRVFTTPGDDYSGQGHGFPRLTRNATYLQALNVDGWSYSGLISPVISVEVYNTTTGVRLTENINYHVNYVDEKVYIDNSVGDGDIVTIIVNGMGGGNQVDKQSIVGTVDEAVVPYPYDLINQIVIFINGQQTFDFDYAPLPGGQTLVTFDSALSANQRATIVSFGDPANSVDSAWSSPVNQIIIADGSLSYTLTNSLQGTNPANTILTVNGIRARPAEGIEHIADGSTSKFVLPTRGGYSLALVADNDVAVWVNNQAQVYGVDFELDPYDVINDTRTINFFTSPSVDSLVLISVRTNAQYWVNGPTLTFQPAKGLSPSAGDVISVTTFNNTVRQNILTQVFVGPESEGVVVSEPFDSVPFDQGTITGDAGSYDYSEGIVITTNDFDIGRLVTNPDRLIVTLDGKFLFEENGFTIENGSIVNITGPAINASQVVTITSLAMRTVPDAMAFRIFKDMRGLQSTYRITAATSARLSQPLSSTADIIYVDDATNLPTPDLAEARFGIVTINGERITYRNKDVNSNTLSGLRRGTAGTGAASHTVGSPVYDITFENYLDINYQDTVVKENFVGNGSQEVFVTDIYLDNIPTTAAEESVLVYVGGERLLSGYQVQQVSPVQVRIIEPPSTGYQVTVAVRQGQVWYQPGAGTPSNGLPLQETDTAAARFLRGLT